jgi:hypothetical protein
MVEVTAALEHEGSVAVIAADAAVERLGKHLSAAGIEIATLYGVESSIRSGVVARWLDGDSEARVTVVPASVAKGLEYDHVIVHEPADIVAAEPRGLNRLYVVLTRAVSRLSVVHSRPLPEALTPVAA